MYLQEALLRYEPHIVHFSGHGSDRGEIVLENRTGQAQTVAPQVLAQLFHTLRDHIRCVVLNACFAATQAQAIVQEIDCVLGMARAIGDPAAIRFAEGFYRGIGYGRSVQTAFELGCNMISLEGLDEASTPQLLVKDGVNPSNIVFDGQPSPVQVNPVQPSSVHVKLAASQRRDLYNALLGAYQQPGDLARMVSLHLNENVLAISSGQNLSDVIFYLIQWAEARDRVTDLIQAAVADRPDNQQIQILAAQLGLAAS